MYTQRYIHHETTNLSFLKLALTLKSLGVENFDFFLQLNDRDLINVDPFDDDLTDGMRMKIYQECTSNPWYYLRECVRVGAPGHGHHTGQPFALNRGTLAIFYLLINNINHFVHLPDQNLRRTTYNVFMTYVLNFKLYKYAKNIEEKNSNITKEVDRIEELLFKLPSYLGSNSIFRSKNNLTNCAKGVKVKNIHIPEEYHNFEKNIRGADASIIVFHDAEYINGIEYVFNAAVPIIHSRHGMIALQSTYNNDDHPSTLFCNHIRQYAMKWEDSYYSLSWKDLRDLMDKNSPNGFIYVKYDYNQIGRSENWLERIKRTYNNDEVKIKRHVLLERDTVEETEQN